MSINGQNIPMPQEMPRETGWQKIKRFCTAHPILIFFIANLFVTVLFTMLSILNALFNASLNGDMDYWYGNPMYAATGIVAIFCMMALLVFPTLITIVNITGLFLNSSHTKTFHIFAAITLVSGTLLTLIYTKINDTITQHDWWEVLVNDERHSPIWSKGVLPLSVLVVLGIIAYIILASRRAYELPPLLIVICMAAMYLWGIICVLLCIQLSGGSADLIMDIPFLILPINCVLLILREIRMKVVEWNSVSETRAQKEWATKWNRLLHKSELWPAFALIAILPILGVLLCVLAIFGQAPDVLIRAFTETADWTFSEKTAPPNVHYDEHYLCTVAAGGNKRIVKPLRMGERHGHRVVVNRQLQIANAFEQVLEERTPRAHHHIRRFYDTYGFPIARLIRTKWACDLVYLLMKPLEWCFLAVLYMTEIHPEDRIAVQYLPKTDIRPL